VVICLERGADLHTAQLMPLPLTVSCFSEIQIGFTFLVPARPGCRGKRAVKRVCVCVYILQYTAMPDATKLSCLCRVRFGGVNWIHDNSRLCPTKYSKSEHVQSNRPIHTRHDKDRTVLSRLAGGVNWSLCPIHTGQTRCDATLQFVYALFRVISVACMPSVL